jgi:hypothetical protein
MYRQIAGLLVMAIGTMMVEILSNKVSGTNNSK